MKKIKLSINGMTQNDLIQLELWLQYYYNKKNGTL